ncbi:probable aspartic proteinase GIP2 [Impatiens glandulifera]|uniref:probable aspartic proteinase GIP2 n=1 Tax=Impatiens glandulifera TaxID=253017 RepID=UPI001FB0BD3D|nr:probable aspartic proteinase GIP2 [Impatiens glandulifera]
MAAASPILQYFLLSIITLNLIHMISISSAQTSFRPSALLIPVTKDSSTNQYITKLNQRTPLVPLNLVLDLGGKYLWLDCETNYISSTYRHVPCNSAQCSLARPLSCVTCTGPSPRPGCNKNTCTVIPDNTVTGFITSGELAEDVLSVKSRNGSNPGRDVQVNRFIFTCGHPNLLEGLAKGASGIAGLGRNRVSLQAQFAAAFSFHRKFAICLSSQTGVVFFGDAPFVSPQGSLEISGSLSYTPLLLNPVSASNGFQLNPERPSPEYFIGVRSIRIDGETVPVNSSLLKIDSKGNGGTKISTVNPYTVLESSIFKAVTNAYVRAATARKIARVEAVGEFEICFKGSELSGTRIGPDVPRVTLVLQSEDVSWDIVGFNLIVKANEETSCLGFLNGGLNSRTSIVIGGHQIEDNLLQFDLASSRLGFSSTLLQSRTNCAAFAQGLAE